MKTIVTTIFTAALSLSIGAGAIAADKKPLPPQASIPFAQNRNAIRDWQADGREGIWVQDQRKQWYYASLLGPCIGLDFATSVGFDTSGSSLDRFSKIIVPNEASCPIMSLSKSDTPPPDRKKKKDSKTSADASVDAEVSGK